MYKRNPKCKIALYINAHVAEVIRVFRIYLVPKQRVESVLTLRKT